jgi:ABC-type transport system involved in multi-copper enzyme maturation permease subunit
MTVKSTKLVIALFAASFVLHIRAPFELVDSINNHERLYDVDSSLWQLATGSDGVTTCLLALLLGTIMVTSEYTFRTIVPTFLATQKRSIVLVSKMVVVFTFSTLFFLLFSIINFVFYYLVNIANDNVFTHQPFAMVFIQGTMLYFIPPIIGFFFASIIAVSLAFLLKNTPLIIVFVLILYFFLPMMPGIFPINVASSTDILPQLGNFALQYNPYALLSILTGTISISGAVNLNSELIYNPLGPTVHIYTSFGTACFGLLIWSVLLFGLSNILLNRKDA